MSLTTRLLFYLILPLTLGGGSLITMYQLVQQFGGGAVVLAGIVIIALLLALLPIALFRILILGQLQEGFALLDSGEVSLPEEVALNALLGDRIVHWVPYHHTLRTTVCLHGEQERIFVNIAVTLTLHHSKQGKKLAKQLEKVLPRLEQTVQQALYNASKMDPDMAHSLSGSVLLNEDDERTLKSKFLSALEMVAINGVDFPLLAEDLQIDRNVQRKALPRPPQDKQSVQEGDELELSLDDSLLDELGLS
ncbi:MAG: hypothetical protein ACQETD_09250 [Pseudomonadota bacterium]